MRITFASISLCNGNTAIFNVEGAEVVLSLCPVPAATPAQTIRFSTLQESQDVADAMAQFGGCRQKDCLRVLRAALPETEQP